MQPVDTLQYKHVLGYHGPSVAHSPTTLPTMTIRIIAPGRQVTAASANGNGVNISIDGHHFVVEANPGDNVQLQLDNGSVDLPPANDDDRRRGWRRLNANNALAYGVDEDKVVVLPACNMNDWMSGLPDDRALADLTLPGTHESASLFGGFISQCQNHDVGQQLQDGIRFFDIRLKAVGNELQSESWSVRVRWAAGGC